MPTKKTISKFRKVAHNGNYTICGEIYGHFSSMTKETIKQYVKEYLQEYYSFATSISITVLSSDREEDTYDKVLYSISAGFSGRALIEFKETK